MTNSMILGLFYLVSTEFVLLVKVEDRLLSSVRDRNKAISLLAS